MNITLGLKTSKAGSSSKKELTWPWLLFVGWLWTFLLITDMTWDSSSLLHDNAHYHVYVDPTYPFLLLMKESRSFSISNIPKHVSYTFVLTNLWKLPMYTQTKQVMEWCCPVNQIMWTYMEWSGPDYIIKFCRKRNYKNCPIIHNWLITFV